jgi:hypothetical protein
VERPRSNVNSERRLGRNVLIIRRTLTRQISCYLDCVGIRRVGDGGAQ